MVDSSALLAAKPDRNSRQQNLNSEAFAELEANNAERQRELIRRQNEYYDREILKANDLQNEIREMQSRLNSPSRSYPTQTYRASEPAYYPNYNQQAYPNNNYNQPLSPTYNPTYPVYNARNVTDTIQKFDTVYVRDTLYIRDTIINNIVERDTVVRLTHGEPLKVFIPVEKEKIVQEKTDYSQQPADIVLFGTGQSNIKSVYNARLDYLSSLLKQDSTLVAIITGHTDKTGSPQINKILSEKRANAVRQYMIDKGVPASQLRIEAVAANDPAVTGNTKSAYSQNRRVTIKLSHGK